MVTLSDSHIRELDSLVRPIDGPEHLDSLDTNKDFVMVERKGVGYRAAVVQASSNKGGRPYLELLIRVPGPQREIIRIGSTDMSFLHNGILLANCTSLATYSDKSSRDYEDADERLQVGAQ